MLWSTEGRSHFTWPFSNRMSQRAAATIVQCQLHPRLDISTDQFFYNVTIMIMQMTLLRFETGWKLKVQHHTKPSSAQLKFRYYHKIEVLVSKCCTWINSEVNYRDITLIFMSTICRPAGNSASKKSKSQDWFIQDVQVRAMILTRFKLMKAACQCAFDVPYESSYLIFKPLRSERSNCWIFLLEDSE